MESKKGAMGCTGAIVYWSLWIVFVCLYIYFSNIRAYRNSDKIKGEVTDKLYYSGYKARYYYPQITFIYKGSEYTCADPHGGIGPSGIGNKVSVIFPKDHPEEAKQYSIFTYWISLTTIFFSLMIGGFLFVIPIFIKYYLDFKKQYKSKA